MKWISILLLSLVTIGLNAQEMLHPATMGTKNIKTKVLKSRAEFTKTGDVLELPFIDDFSVDRFPGNQSGRTVLWEQRKATINDGWGLNPPSIGVVSFDGADEVGYPYDWSAGSGPADTLTSCPIDLTGEAGDQIGLSFYYQAKGNAPFPPSVTDSLRLEFYAPELDEWRREWATADISTTDGFTFVYIPIVLSRYLQEGFRFRFVNFAPLQGAIGTWNLDYVWLDRNANNAEPAVNDIAFSRQEFTFLDGLTTMPRSHFAANPASFMRPDITVELNNLNDLPRTLENNGFRVGFEGVVTDQFDNPNEPAIGAESNLDYFHSVGAAPNSFVFNPSLSDEDVLNFDVEIYHGVSDFFETQSNDTMRFTQSFFTEYAYDDGSAEAAYSVPQAGDEVAMRFTAFETDSIFAVKIYFMPFAFDYEGTTVTIRIWEADNNGPGLLIAEAQKQVVYGIEDYQEVIVYSFPEPIEIPAGSFFIGYGQSNQFEGLRIGLDRNTNANEENLYFKTGGPNWNSSQIPGSLMIRPMFTSEGYEDIIASTNFRDFSKEVRVFPNPAREFFSWTSDEWLPTQLSMSDLSGRVVVQTFLSNNRGDVNTSGLSEGLYILSLTDALGNRAVKKVIVEN